MRSQKSVVCMLILILSPFSSTPVFSNEPTANCQEKTDKQNYLVSAATVILLQVPTIVKGFYATWKSPLSKNKKLKYSGLTVMAAITGDISNLLIMHFMPNSVSNSIKIATSVVFGSWLSESLSTTLLNRVEIRQQRSILKAQSFRQLKFLSENPSHSTSVNFDSFGQAQL